MFENYKKNDPRFLWYYSKYGKLVIILVIRSVIGIIIFGKLA